MGTFITRHIDGILQACSIACLVGICAQHAEAGPRPDAETAPVSGTSRSSVIRPEREATYEGLTLDQWTAALTSGEGPRVSLACDTSESQFWGDDNTIFFYLLALEGFARESERAIALVESLARDLDENVRERATDILIQEATGQHPTSPLAKAALEHLEQSDRPVSRSTNVEATYRGLTLDQWTQTFHARTQAAVWLDAGEQTGIRYGSSLKMDVFQYLSVLQSFSPVSKRAIAILEELAQDLDEEVRDSATEILTAESRAQHPTRTLARAAVRRLGAARKGGAANSDRTPTYRGLTLDQYGELIDIDTVAWVVVSPTPSSSEEQELHVAFFSNNRESGVFRKLEALSSFAGVSDQSIAELESLAYDLSEVVGREAAWILAGESRTDHPTSSRARAAIERLLRCPDERVLHSAIVAINAEYMDEDAESWQADDNESLRVAFRNACTSVFENASSEEKLEEALDVILDAGSRDPHVIEAALDTFHSDPLPWTSASCGEALNSFAWYAIDVDAEAAQEGLELAREAASAAASILSEEPYVWDTLAFAHWRLGERAEALRAMDRCIALAKAQDSEELDLFERCRRMLDDDRNWTPKARAAARVLPD